MLNMENAEEVMQILERFTRLKQKEIPKELDDYMHYVAKTGDTVFKWSSLKYLFREKLLNVIKNFHDTSPRVDDLPQYPNVDPFNYESMKSSLLERLELFNAAPFTVQRLCELLTEPRKQYSRIDKFMRALEKNILVVSTIEPGRKQTESENGDSLDSVVNGDVSLDVNVDIEMENETIFNAADAQNNATPSESTPAQPSSNLIHKSDDDILPNPKKAKLDLDENNDAETEAATKSITSSKLETTTIIPSVEVTMAEDTTNSTEEKKQQNEDPVSEDKPAAVENVVESIKKDKKDAEAEKMEEDLPASAPIDETKEEVKTDVKESENKSEEKDSTPAIPASTGQVAQEESEQPKTAEATTVDSTDTDTKTAAKESADKKENCSQEQIIEKTKEVAEKENTTNEEVQNGDVKPSELKTETNITTTETTNDKQSEMVVEEQTVAPASEKKIEDVLKNENVETAEAPSAIAAAEKQVESEAVPTPAAQDEAKAANVKLANEAIPASEEKSKPVEETKVLVIENSTSTVMEVDASVQAKTVTTESPQTESVAKEAEVKCTEVTEKETDKPKAADLPAVDAPTNEAPAVAEPTVEKAVDIPSVEATPSDATPSAVEKAAIVEKVVTAENAEVEKPATEKVSAEKAAVEKSEVEKVEVDKADIEKEAAEKQAVEKKSAIDMPEKASPPTVDTSAITPPTDDSPAITAASSETKPETATPTTAATPAVAETPSTVTPAIAEPVITADQPMEENPESIAEAEPVVPAIVVEAATTVEEVVMGGDSVEMATDAIEPTKDEPAGMEVDDTSQEAMDQ